MKRNLLSNLSRPGTRIICTIALLVLNICFWQNAHATVLINSTGGGFENGSTLAANGWTAVNNASSTVNNWSVGTGGGTSGSNFAYISNNSGSTYNYDNTTSSIVHFYQSVTVPAGETNIQLSFNLRSVGELNTDEMLVYAGTGTLTAGSLPGAGYTAIFTQNSTSTWAGYATVYVTLPAALAGTTFNLVFTWQNDNNSAGSQPPASVDYISLTSASCIISTFPWTEGFEYLSSFGSGVVPPCWATQDVSGPNWRSANAPFGNDAQGAHSGNNFMYSTYSANAWMFTPGMQLTGGTTYYFSYYYLATINAAGGTFTTAVGTAQDAADMTTTLGTIVNVVNTSYQLAYYAYTPSTTGVYYFGINSNSSNPPWYFNVDDVSVTTSSPCVITSFPWTEGFETTTPGSGNVPACWNTQDVSGNNWIADNTSEHSGVAAHTGTHFMYSSYSANAWMYTVGMQLTGGTTYYFSYYYALTDAISGFVLTTAVGNAQNSTAMTTTLGTLTNPLNTTYLQAVYTYTPPTSGVYYFGINSTCPNPPWYLNVDDIEVQANTCAAPTTTTASIASSTSANANWTCAGCTGNYIVEYGPSATFTTPGTGASAGTNGTVVDVSAGNFTALLSGLASGTTYTYFVRQDCGGGVYSPSIGSQTFNTAYCTSLYTTGCAAADYINNFSLSNVTQTNTGCSGTSNTPSAGYADFSATFGDTVNLVRGNTYTWAATYGYGSGEYLKIWIDFNDNGILDDSGELVYDGTLTGANLASGNFTLSSSAATGTHRMRVRDVYAYTAFGPCGIYNNGEGEAQDYTCSVTSPSCPVPASSAVTNITFVSGQANWSCTGGCTGNFILEYGPTATFVPGTGATAGTNGTIMNLSSGSTSATIPGLTPGTQYTCYVREDCSGTGSGYSANSAGQNFTTIGTLVVNQQVNQVPPGTTGVNILRIDLPLAGNIAPLTLNSIKFTSENTSDADITASGVKLWTGTTSGPATQIGTSQTFASGAVTFSGLNLSLPTGTTYYFWLTYDIASTATALDVADAKINAGDISFTVGGSGATLPATLQDPAGNVQIAYCTTLYTTGCAAADYINSFSLSNLNLTNLGCAGTSNTWNAGYADYTTSKPTIDLVDGATYTWTATYGYGSGEYLKIWIDLNDNGEFTDAGELIYDGTLTGANLASGSFTLSPTATTGTHRMRVRDVYAYTAFGPCGIYNNGEGEVQDYTVSITAPNCPVPTSFAATSVGLTSAQANWTCTGCIGGFIIEYGPYGFTPGSGTMPGTNGTTITVAAGNTSTMINGLTPGTQYTYYIRQDCSASSNGYSINSAPQSFTTPTVVTVGTIIANQQTNQVPPGTTGVNITELVIPVTGSVGTLTLNSLTVTSENTTDADIAASGVKLWTGTSSGPTTQISSSQTFSSGAVTFSGLNMSMTGVNTYYLWLTYDISSSATLLDVADAKINAGDISFSVSGGAIAGTQPPSVLDPAGNVEIGYCTTLYTTGCAAADYINDFSLSNLSLTNLGCAGTSNTWNAGYADYTTSKPTIDLTDGATYTWTATYGYGSGEYLKIWIDLNNNGEFTDAGELVYDGTLTGANLASGTFTLSPSAATGTHRMRVRDVYAYTAFGPCGIYNNGEGEVQDYTCNITAPNCPVPSSTSATSVTFSSAQANWTCSGCTGSYIVEYGPAGFTPGTGTTQGTNGTIIDVASGNTSVLINGLNNAAQYTYYVREDCSSSSNGYSINSAGQSFTTLGTIVANQFTGTDQPGTAGINILRLDIPVTGNIATLILNSIKFTSENTSDADIVATGVKLYTGTTSGPTTQIGTSQTFSSGAVTFSGLNLNLATGNTYYLWVTYDITSGAILGDILDAKVNTGDISFTSAGAGVTMPSSPLDPAGNVVVNYCTSLYTTGCAAADYISSFSLSNLTLTGLGCYGTSNTPTAGYADLTSSEPTINLVTGASYTWTANYGYGSGEYLKIWIDLNDNGVFTDAGELIYDGTLTGANVSSGSFTISAFANPGNHRMRVRDVYAYTAFGPCGQYNNGEGEVLDFTVNISAIPMVYVSSTTTQNSIDVTSNSTNQMIVGLQVTTTGSLTPLSLSSINFNATGTSNPSVDISNARIYYTGTSSSFATTGQFGSTIASPSGAMTVPGSQTLAEGVNYFWLTYDIPAGAPTGDYADGAITQIVVGGVSKTPTSTATTTRQIELYCDPSPYVDCNSSPDGGISRVRLNNIDNSSGCSTSGDYTNYTINPTATQTTTLIAGQTYTIIINRATNTNVAYTVKVWIDYNHDGTFTNASPELIYSFTSTNFSGFSGSFNVPMTAVSGNTRMRVRMAQNVDDACDNPGCVSCTTNYGETEDYMVTICVPPTIINQPANTAVCTGAPVQLTVNSAGTPSTYQWQKATNNISGATDSIYSIPSAASGDAANYTVVINNACGTITSNPAVVTVNPLPAVATGLTNQAVCGNGNVTFSVNDPGAGYTVEWSTDGATNNDGTATGGSGSFTKTKAVTIGSPITEYVSISNSTTGCNSAWISATGTANTPPALFDVTGGTCVPALLGLSGSESGVNYQMTLNGTPYGSVMAGTNAALNFGLQSSPGVFNIKATNATTGCADTMIGIYDVTICTATWTGATSTDWFDPTNWSPQAVPNVCGVTVIINSPMTRYPVISGANVTAGTVDISAGASITLDRQTLSICSNWNGSSGAADTINGTGMVILTGSAAQTISGNTLFNIVQVANTNGGVSLATDAVVTINIGLQLASGNLDVSQGKLHFPSTSSSTDTYIDDFSFGQSPGTITGNVSIDRYAPVKGFNQHYISLPVSTPPFSQLNASGSPDGEYVVPTADCNETQSAYRSPYGTVFQYNDGHMPDGGCMLGNWQVRETGNTVNGVGYSVYLTGDTTLTVVSSANTGDISVGGLNYSGYNTVNTLQGDPIESGWNLVGNPYPSALNITTNRSAQGFQNQVQIWQTSGPFAGTWEGGLIIPGSGIQIATPQGMAFVDIAPFQAFMVRVDPLSSTGLHTYNFYQDERIRATDVPFYRTQSENSLILTVDYNGMQDVTAVEFNQSGTYGFDAAYDADKQDGSPGRPTLYTYFNDQDIWYAINTVSALTQTATVPMGLRAQNNGAMTITPEGLQSFDPTTYIYLEDTKTGIWANLRDGAYAFNTLTTDSQNRFVLHFTPPAVILTQDASCQSGGMINITQPGTAKWNYALVDANNINISSGILNTSTPVNINAEPGVYTLTLTDNTGYTVVKSIQVGGTEVVSGAFGTSQNTAAVQQNITFTGNSPDATVYNWNFGDGGTANGQTAVHSFLQQGIYNVLLNVSSPAGCTSSTTHAVVITARSATGVNTPGNTGSIEIWSNGNRVFIDFSKQNNVNADIEMYDVLGQLIARETFSRSSLYSHELTNLDAAYVIVKVVNGNEVTTKKVFIINK